MAHWLLGEGVAGLEARDFRGAEAATAVTTSTHKNYPEIIPLKTRIKVDTSTTHRWNNDDDVSRLFPFLLE